MAKTKQTYQAPKTMEISEEGMQDVTVKLDLPEVKDKAGKVTREKVEGHMITVRIPKNAAGIKNLQNTFNSLKIEGKDGNSLLIDALAGSIIQQAKQETVKAHKEGQKLPNVLSIVPDFSVPRFLDPNEAKGNMLKDALTSGKLDVNSPEVRALFAKLGVK